MGRSLSTLWKFIPQSAANGLRDLMCAWPLDKKRGPDSTVPLDKHAWRCEMKGANPAAQSGSAAIRPHDAALSRPAWELMWRFVRRRPRNPHEEPCNE